MDDQKEKVYFLRIDTRYNRIGIHRHTLESIGDPEFIHLGFHPTTGRIMVLGTWGDEKKAIRVHYDQKGSFYFYSKSLIDGIRMINGALNKQGSYLFKGNLVDSIPAICFSVCDTENEKNEV